MARPPDVAGGARPASGDAAAAGGAQPAPARGRSLPGGFLGRFLVSGAFNTLLTYALYLLLLAPLGHRWAYTAVFAAGIALAYGLNRVFVFRAHAGWRSALAMPLIYGLQYALGLAVVALWVEWLGWPAVVAPLAAIALTLPVTYGLSRLAFLK